MLCRVACLCVAVAAVCAVPVLKSPKHDMNTPLQMLIEHRDSLSSLMSDIMAFQSSDHITGRNELIEEFQQRLQALGQSLREEEESDKIATSQLLTDMTSQLAHAQLVLATTPDQIHEMEALLHRSWSSGNQTSQNIENLRVLQAQFQNEVSTIRTEMDSLRDQHHQRVSDIDHDLALLKSITDLLTSQVGCSVSALQQSMAQFLAQSHTSTSPSHTTSSFLQLQSTLESSTPIPGCCVTFQNDPITEKPALFQFKDGVNGSDCVVSGNGTHANHHVGMLCGSIEFLYDQASREVDQCTQQHHTSGPSSCNDITLCGNPAICSMCVYDNVSDVCYTDSCQVKSLRYHSSCLSFDNCFTSTPSSSCCNDITSYLSAGCDADAMDVVCGVAVREKANQCAGSIADSDMCTQLHHMFENLNEELLTSRKQEEVLYGSQLAEIQKERHLAEANLQKTVNEIDMLQIELSSTIERAESYEANLSQLTEITVADAEQRVANIPEQIENAKQARQARKEKRDDEVQLINKLSIVIRSLTGDDASDTQQPQIITSDGVVCYQFNRPGYYYHPDGQQPTQISCPNDNSCGFEKVVLTPLTQPQVFIVRMGCFSDLVSDPALNVKECGATSCPSSQAIYTVECCSGDLCNTVDGPIASRTYEPGQCDPDACTCHPPKVNVRPSAYPSVSALPSPSITLSATSSVSPSETPSVSRSFSASPSPSISTNALSCDAIKSENPDATSGVYEMSFGAESHHHNVYCDMDVDHSVGYTLLWKNVGGHVTQPFQNLASDSDLMSEYRTDTVFPPFSSTHQTQPDGSQFNTPAFRYYASQNHTEWVKYMVLYDGETRIRSQRVKIVMSDVTMNDVFNQDAEEIATTPSSSSSSSSSVCVRTNGYFHMYSTSDITNLNRIDSFMGRTSIITRGKDHSGMSSFGLPTAQENVCVGVHKSNLIQDVSNLRRLTDDLQLGTNEAWETVQHIFGYDHNSVNPRDFSRCMFRCWNDRDGNYRETFVWGARLGCPGFLYSTEQRCSGHGECRVGVCHCDDGWTGEGCSAKRVEPLCGPQPHIANGSEICDDDECRVNCDRGFVLNGPSTWQCADDRQWHGPTVSQCVPECSHNCSGRGVCVAPGQCECELGWVGPGCESKRCRSEPQRIHHGEIMCDNQNSINHTCTIQCDDGYTILGNHQIECDNGEWTSLGSCVPLCPPNDCSHHGTCVSPGICECYSGFKGVDCHLPDCAQVNQCSSHGICVATNVCLCDREWDGPECDLKVRVLSDVAMMLVGNSSQAIEIPAIGTFNDTTVEFWMLPDHFDLDTMILEATQSVGGAISIGVHNRSIRVDLEGFGSTQFATRLIVGIWTHVAISIDTSSHVIKLYIDGQKVEQLNILGSRVNFVTSRLGGTLRHPFTGLMKELRIWNRIRSSLHIATSTYSALTGTEEGIEALYAMSGPMSANTVYLDDLTGRHGVRITGGVWVRAATAPPGPRSLPPIYHSTPQ